MRNILASQRGPLPRGWFDIALGCDELRCLDFIEKIATAKTRSWWHVSQFIDVEGEAAASLCAFARCGHRTRGACGHRRNRRATEAPPISRRGLSLLHTRDLTSQSRPFEQASHNLSSIGVALYDININIDKTQAPTPIFRQLARRRRRWKGISADQGTAANADGRAKDETGDDAERSDLHPH